MENKKKLIDSFLRNPTIYTIQVRDGSMLEDPKAKEIKWEIKPPTTHVLSLCASVIGQIPDEIKQSEDIDLETAMEHRHKMLQMLCILRFERNDYEDFWETFLLKNISSIELLQIVQEMALKCNPSFFLNSIQIAKETNPMILKKNTSIPTNS